MTPPIRLIESMQRLQLCRVLVSLGARYDYDCVLMILDSHKRALRRPGRSELARRLVKWYLCRHSSPQAVNYLHAHGAQDSSVRDIDVGGGTVAPVAPNRELRRVEHAVDGEPDKGAAERR